MSWDVTFMRTPEEVRSFNDLPKGFKPPSLGEREQVIRHLSEILPEFDFTNAWGVFEGNDHSITLNFVALDDPDEINLLAAHVRGGIGSVYTLKKIWGIMDCSAFDDGTGERIDNSADPARGFRKWKGFKGKIIGAKESNGIK